MITSVRNPLEFSNCFFGGVAYDAKSLHEIQFKEEQAVKFDQLPSEDEISNDSFEISNDSFSVFDTILSEDFKFVESNDESSDAEFVIETDEPSPPLKRTRSLPSLYNPNAHLPFSASPQGISQDSSLVQDTTLLKHVPFDDDGIDKYDLVEIRKGLGNSAPVDPHDIVARDCQDLVKIIDFGPSYVGAEVGPVFQVVGVYIFHDDDDCWEPFEIYGEISVIDEKSNQCFCMYERKSEDPETVYPPDHDCLSLIPEPIAPIMKGKVVFNLTNKTRGTHFKEEKSVDYLITDDCGFGKRLSVKGFDGYYVEMIYTIIPFAHVATVSSMEFEGPSEPNMDKFEVVGDITGDGISFLKEQYFEAVESFDENSAHYFVKQSRTVFAIPVYSELVVEINMHHNETELINTARASSPYGIRISNILIFDSEDKEHQLTMVVNWYSPTEYFDLHPQLNKPVSDGYVEVFSVYVGGGNSTLALCGSIKVRDPKSKVYIFARKSNYPDKLSSNMDQLFMRTVALSWPECWVPEKGFNMHLKLRDNQGNPVCGGTLRRTDYPPSFDRRICAIIRGENGHHVAVHYSIFRNALRATVTVLCEGMCSSFDAYGSVYAEYGNYDYSSMYDQNYYRVIIFNRSEEYRANVENGSEIPLSKSKITAPPDCAYIVVYVDLTIRPTRSPFKDHYASGKLKFKAGGIQCSEPVLIFRRQNCLGRVTVKVDWNL